MILCTIGTTEFDPLVRAMDGLVPSLDEPVIFQIGQGTYEPVHGKWFRLRPTISDLIAEASLVVAHGGFGTTVEVLEAHRPLVSMPNPDRYDRHQEQLLRRFAADGYLLACFDLSELATYIAQARQKNFVLYQPPQTTLHIEIKAFLERRVRQG